VVGAPVIRPPGLTAPPTVLPILSIVVLANLGAQGRRGERMTGRPFIWSLVGSLSASRISLPLLVSLPFYLRALMQSDY
jgi:ABC-type molybdate transport system permease subunit